MNKKHIDIMNKKHNEGYTLIEIMFLISVICSLAIVGTLLFVACHFIAKFW